MVFLLTLIEGRRQTRRCEIQKRASGSDDQDSGQFVGKPSLIGQVRLPVNRPDQPDEPTDCSPGAARLKFHSHFPLGLTSRGLLPKAVRITRLRGFQ